jgi:hypothetical protein
LILSVDSPAVAGRTSRGYMAKQFRVALQSSLGGAKKKSPGF